jgi:hypothetical protein
VQGEFGLTVFGNLGQPVIKTQPDSTAVVPGGSVTLRVGVSGPGPFTYQWQQDGANLSGQTNATLTLSNVQADTDSGSYTVEVSNVNGTVSSAAATVVIAVAPTLAIDTDRQLQLTGTGGVTYQIEYREEWVDTEWQPLTQITLAEDPSMPNQSEASFADPLPEGVHRFYRATVVVPASSNSTAQ